MANSNAVIPTTQRAYTLRLRGGDKNDHSWRDALWATHEAVNKGTKVFGNWLLTLRGGLDHTLADRKVKGRKNKPNRDPTDEERKGRRILLALSWLSVESKIGAPENFIVTTGEKDAAAQNSKVVGALEEILRNRGVAKDEIEEWKKDCSLSLTATIRNDAVWVNRSDAFDSLCSLLTGMDRAYAGKVIQSFFGSFGDYLSIPSATNDEETNNATSASEGPEFRTLARQWVSTNFGTGKKSDTIRISNALKKLTSVDLSNFVGRSKDELLKHLVNLLDVRGDGDDPQETLRVAIGWKGRPSKGRLAVQNLADPLTKDAIATLQTKFAEEMTDKQGKAGLREVPDWIPQFQKSIEQTCGIPFVGSRNHIGEFSVMLDHAARRVSLAHTWIKRAEAERRAFEEDAKRMALVPNGIKTWLDAYCARRSGVSGALELYRIRPGALGGKHRKAWKAVVEAWSKKDCQTEEDRSETARLVQAEWGDGDEKFGDIQLFEALADDDAICVWHKEGDPAKAPDHQPLIDYVLATDAEAKQRRFKVPAYRHPDALLHPVFCDFGKSRWDISFAVHAARKKMPKTQKNIKRRREALEKAEQAVEKVCGDRQKESKAQDKLKKAQAELAEAKASLAWLSSPHALSMTLWTGSSVKPEPSLCWQSKRLVHDLALGQGEPGDKDPDITRADRLGRAAAGVPAHDAVSIAGIFEQQDWNGRLQAPRSQLDAIGARVAKHGWDAKAKQMRDQLRWLITFSAKLQPSGPWIEYAAAFPDDAPARPFVSRRGEYAVKHQSNNARKGHAKLVLARLPGLRVLSVDLGHRYAAACAVWETLTIQKINAACKAANHAPPAETDLFFHLATTGADGRPRTTIYRRIGADYIEDVDQDTGELRQVRHPAPWARLERQFLIKLQGEDEEARKASPSEVAAVQKIEKGVGREPLDRRSLGVNDLMSDTVRTVRIALKRHGRCARIAFNLTATKKRLPGGREEALTDDGRVALLAETLADWYALFTGKGWTDEWAKQQWETHITPLLQGAALPRTPADADVTPKARKKHRADLTEKLKPVADNLAKNDSLCRKLHCLWATRWREDDGVEAQTEHEVDAAGKRTGKTKVAVRATGWHAHLRWIEDWILPRGKKAETDRAIRHVGGLSLTRIATIKSLYQVQKAYHMRPEPEDPRKNVPAKGEDELRYFGRKILGAMERMREQRVKQLASRIAEAALGVGRMKPAKGRRDRKRPRARVDEPCHAVVIENLTRYRPEETRTRRENRQLMAWSAAKVKKFLSEACQLNGLHLREVQAGYTSRQDSRTGAPGIRCQDVPVEKFMQSPFWRKQVAQAEKKRAGGKGDAREQFLCGLNAKWKDKTEAEWKAAKPVRIPLKGGEIFVSANPKSPAAKGLQADLNAAANIGLKALLDPDWPGKWWYIPCCAKDGKPFLDKVTGAACIDLDKPLCVPPDESKDKIKKKEIVNVWRDPSAASMNGSWQRTAAYWNMVRSRVVEVLRRANGLEIPAKNTIESMEIPW